MISSSQRMLIVISVMLVTVIEILDMTIVNVALPPMMGQLGASSDQITWVLTSYIVASAIVMPLTGFLVDQIGRKKLLLIDIAGFLASSMICGISTSLTEMVIFRTLQGIFGASLVPMSQYILRDTFPPEEQGKAMAIWGVGVMVAPVLGPTLGGFITEALTWRWVFYINIPICVIAFFLTMISIEETPVKRHGIDVMGLILMAVGVGALQVFLDRGNTAGWFSSNFIVTTTAITIICLTIFIIRGIALGEKNIVNLHLFANRNFWVGTLLFTLFSMGVISVIAVQPLLLEHLMNYTAETSGNVMAPRGIAAAVSMFAAGMLANRIDMRWLLLLGVLICSAGTFYMADVNLQTSFSVMAWQGAVQGFGMGFFFVPISMVAINDLAEKDIAEASGLFGFGRSLGSSVGISIISTIITQVTQVNWNELSGNFNVTSYNFQRWLQLQHLSASSPEAMQRMAQQLSNQATLIAFTDAFWIVGVAFLLMIPLVFLLKKGSHPVVGHGLH